MDTPISWIKAYVPDLDCTPQEYADKMTLSGSNMESVTYLDKNLEKIVVGKIEKIEKHPDADKLIICQVNVGDETVQIVTGAKRMIINTKKNTQVGSVIGKVKLKSNKFIGCGFRNSMQRNKKVRIPPISYKV